MRSGAGRQAGARHREVEIANLTRGTLLGAHIQVAENARARAIGLLGQRRLDPGGGLLIDPSSGIHTFGMRFSIDVVAVDRHLCVRGVREALGAFRIAGLSWKTSCVVELPVGAIRESATQPGDQLELRTAGVSVPLTTEGSTRIRRRAGKRYTTVALSVVLALACYVLNYRVLRPVVLRANPTIDFACYYRSAAMVMAGDGVSLYDVKAQHGYDIQLRRAMGAARFDSRRFLAPPFVLLYYLPFAWLAFARAQVAWYVFNGGLLLGLPFVLRPVLGRGKLQAAAVLAPALFLPVLFTLIEGQNTALLVFLLAMSFIAFARNAPVYCGCLLALAGFKPHLVLPLLLGFLLSREWEVIAGFGSAAVALLGASAALAGWQATLSFGSTVVDFTRLPAEFGGDSPWAMPNLRGALYILLHDRVSAHALAMATLIASALLMIAAAICFARCRKRAPELGFALALVIAVLTSYHGYFHEAALLLPAFLLTAASVMRGGSARLRWVYLAAISILYVAPAAASSFQQAVLMMVAAMFAFVAGLSIDALRTLQHRHEEAALALPVFNPPAYG